MRYSLTLPVMAALALEAVAHPLTHGHQHFHNRRAATSLRAPVEERDINWKDPSFYKDVDWAKAYANGIAAEHGSATTTTPAAASTPTPSPAASPAAAASPANAAGNAFVEKVKDTADSAANTALSLVGMSLNQMVSKASSWFDSSDLALSVLKVAKNVGSFGSPTCQGASCGGDMTSLGNYGSPYGSNMMLVGGTDGNDYTHTIINSSPEDVVIVVWNKAGADGGPYTGQSTATTGPALAFPLAQGATQVVAFQAGSNAIFCPLQKGTGKILSGAPDCTWAEFNYLSSGPAYDVSSIANSKGNNYKMTMTNSFDGCVSSQSVNHWISPTGTTNMVGEWVDASSKAIVNACAAGTALSSYHITSELFGTM